MTLNKNEPLLLVTVLCREGNKKQISTLVSKPRYSNKVHEFLESCRFIWNLLQLSALLLVLFNFRVWVELFLLHATIHSSASKFCKMRLSIKLTCQNWTVAHPHSLSQQNPILQSLKLRADTALVLGSIIASKRPKCNNYRYCKMHVSKLLLNIWNQLFVI